GRGADFQRGWRRFAGDPGGHRSGRAVGRPRLRCAGGVARRRCRDRGRRAGDAAAGGVTRKSPGMMPGLEGGRGWPPSYFLSTAVMRARAVSTLARELKALMRTWPSPQAPKPAPGVQTTWASLRSLSKKAQESVPVLIQM